MDEPAPDSDAVTNPRHVPLQPRIEADASAGGMEHEQDAIKDTGIMLVLMLLLALVIVWPGLSPSLPG
jgi:hypothetical protein